MQFSRTSSISYRRLWTRWRFSPRRRSCRPLAWTPGCLCRISRDKLELRGWIFLCQTPWRILMATRSGLLNPKVPAFCVVSGHFYTVFSAWNSWMKPQTQFVLKLRGTFKYAVVKQGECAGQIFWIPCDSTEVQSGAKTARAWKLFIWNVRGKQCVW